MEMQFTLTGKEYNNIADVNLKLKRLSLAEEYVKMAIAKEKSPLFLVTYAEVLLEKGANDLAEETLLEALKSEENNEYANMILASVYINQGRKVEAKRIVEQYDTVQSVYSQKWSLIQSQLK